MHIYRIDHDQSRTHSWLVTVQRRGKIYHRHFTDNVYGGKRKALDAAKTYRDNLIARLRPLTRLEVCRIKKRNNRSGISGVTRIDADENNRGRVYHRRYWLAQWPTERGKARMKKFSIKLYGEQGARHRAVRVRRQALKNLAQTSL
jgi:AP2 domain